MAVQHPPKTVTIPSISYVESVEDRTRRITIDTPKDGAITVEVLRERRESRDGVLHESRQYSLPVALEAILAHPLGPVTMANIAQILDDIATPTSAPG
jgi:hypothetical protein